MNDIFCRYADLPWKVNAVTVVDKNGDYNVYVNTKLSSEAQRRAYDHERRHIEKDHFYKNKTVSQCEKEAE